MPVKMYRKYLGVLFVFVLYRFMPLFIVLPRYAIHLVYLLVACMYLFINRNWIWMLIQKVNCSKCLTYSFVSYFIAVLWGCFVVVFRNEETSYLLQQLGSTVWQSVIVYMFLLVVTKRVLHPQNLLYTFMQLFIISQCINILCSIVFILIPEIKEFWIHIISQTAGQQSGLLQSRFLSRIGLRGFSNFKDTIECSIGIIFCISAFDQSRFLVSIIEILLLILGNFFYGRSGLLFSIGIALFTAFWRLNRNRIAMLIIGSIFVYVIWGCITDFVAENRQFSSSLQWAIQPFTTFLYSWERGYFSLGDSSDTMFRMYFVPEDGLTILIGDGKYTNSDGSYYMHTDVGFMRHMLFYGVIGETLGYLSFGFLLLALEKLAKRMDNPRWRELALMFFLLTFYFEIKGDPFFNFFGIILAVCIGAENQVYKNLIR